MSFEDLLVHDTKNAKRSSKAVTIKTSNVKLSKEEKLKLEDERHNNAMLILKGKRETFYNLPTPLSDQKVAAVNKQIRRENRKHRINIKKINQD